MRITSSATSDRVGIDAEGRVNGSEFRLRPHRPDDVGLSVNWLERFGDIGKSGQLRAVRDLFRLSVKRTGRFVELNVGQTRVHLANELPQLLFIEDPLEAMEQFEADPSHSLIVGLPSGDTPEAELIGDMIAECIIGSHPALPEAGT